jgi:DNA-binding transcriptional LysR family regulator
MHLNPESLSFALLISDLGSIARAANILGMKQATLSRKLTALESRVGVRLFDRSTRGAVPTVSGAGFLNQARRIVADLDTLLTSSRAAASVMLRTRAIGPRRPLRARCSHSKRHLIFPVVGMPLPFFSYGGSSMVTICVCLGLLIAIDRDSMRQHNRA